MELLGGVGDRRRCCGTAAAQIAQRPADDRASSSSFVAALFMMYGPVKKLSRVNANLQQAIAASERIFEMLDTHTEVQRAARRAGRCAPFAAAIEFRDVSFAYDDGRRDDPARRVVLRSAPGRWSRSSGAAAPARRRWSTCCRGSTTSPAARS